MYRERERRNKCFIERLITVLWFLGFFMYFLELKDTKVQPIDRSSLSKVMGSFCYIHTIVIRMIPQKSLLYYLMPDA